MIGKSVLHYKVIRELGRGGMGVVYQAEDTRLGRRVALKFLPQQFAPDSNERARFEREARAAAALNHPNIAHVYAIEEFEGHPFIVMEHVDGRELRDVIAGERLPYERCLEIAGQIASALKAAHERGVVHRDIKSANIMIANDGVAKVTDFGLAHMNNSDTRLTKSGTTVGTVDYMSPEQVRGEHVDARSDIWSFGVVLYEMLRGERPFRGDYEQAVMYLILHENPKPVSEHPAEIANVVSKMLAREPTERFQSMDEVVTALRAAKHDATAPSRTPAPASKPRLPGIAVLPFASIRHDPETSFLGFALADQIIGALTYVDTIAVRPSSAVRKYQNTDVDVSAAGRELHADYVLTGHFLKEAETLRLNVELVTVPASELMWRDSIEVKYESAFKVQDLVSKKVLRGLKVQFQPAEGAAIGPEVPAEPLAYEYYLRAIAYPQSVEGDKLAIGMLNESIKLDPSYAPAHAELGYRIAQRGAYGLLGRENQQAAEKAYRKAISLNKNQLTALNFLSHLYVELGRHEEGARLIQRMFKVTPNAAMAHFSLGYLYRYTGQLDESARCVAQALALDPRNPRFRSGGFTYYYRGEYQKAFDAFRLDDTSPLGAAWQGNSLLLMGEKERAVPYYDRAIAIEPTGYIGLRHSAIRAHVLGRPEEALGYVRKLETLNPAESDSEHWYLISNVNALLGQRDACIAAARRAVEGGFFCYPTFVRDPFFESVRDDAEFQSIVQLAKEKHEAAKKSLAFLDSIGS